MTHYGPRVCSATGYPVAERLAYTRREIDYPTQRLGAAPNALDGQPGLEA